MNPVSFVLWGGLAAGALLIASTGATWVHDYRGLVEKVGALEHAKKLDDGRLASYKRMIDRRDAAIDASKCKPQLKEWVAHPENIPQPFDPFHQLGN